MKSNGKAKILPNRDTHRCFGCSPVNASGLQMTFHGDGQSVFSDLTVPAHLCGWDRLVHGGVITAILDEAMSWGALHLLRQVILTKSINVDFIKPVLIEEPLRARARVLAADQPREAVMEGQLHNAAGDLCARSRGTFGIFSPAVARRLKIADDATLEWFKEIMEV